jgi:hypothetical protein
MKNMQYLIIDYLWNRDRSVKLMGELRSSHSIISIHSRQVILDRTRFHPQNEMFADQILHIKLNIIYEIRKIK